MSINKRFSDPLFRVIVGAAALLGVLHVGLLFFRESEPVLAEIPMFVPMIHGFAVLESITIAFLALGSHRAMRNPVTWWIGIAFASMAIFNIFYILSWPGLRADGQPVIELLSGTAAWIIGIAQILFSLLLIIGVSARWPGENALKGRNWAWSVASWLVLVTLIIVLLIVSEENLPSMIGPHGTFTFLLLVLAAVTAVLYATGAVTLTRYYIRSHDVLPGYVALDLVLLSYNSLGVVMTTKRYALMWYTSRLLAIVGGMIVLFGLLWAYVRLYQKEQEKSRELEASVTERKQAEEALQKAHDDLELRVRERTAELESTKEAMTAERQRLYDVLETLPVYVCLLNSDYHMPFANRYFRETFGESRGRRCHDFLFNRIEPCEICETYTVMKTRAPHQWFWTGPNGRDYDIYDFPFIDIDGSFLILEMGMDITERKQAEDALKQTLADLTRSNADLEKFAYVASHDLQEPLRNVASCLQMLEKKYKNNLDADADQYINHAVEGAVRMRALIQDLLAYSRIETRGKPLEQIDCEQILDRTVKNLGPTIFEAGAVITHEPLPTIVADDTQLLQVFQNLVANAVKFRRDEPPQIHVSAAKNNTEWIFSVRDNGIGIESQHLERIFVIFQRLNKRTQYDGTGMGLAIVKKVVERHRGRVWVESEPGKGTTFYFTMPEKGIQT